MIHQNEVFGDLGGVLLTKPSFIKQIIPEPKLLLQLHPKSEHLLLAGSPMKLRERGYHFGVPTGSNHELEQVDLHVFCA